MIIILTMFYAMTGYILEGIFNRITMGPIVEKKLDKNPKAMFCYSSIWMMPLFALAGLSISLIYHYAPFFHQYLAIPLIMLMGGIIIDIIELGGGLLLNKVLKLKIWDYSHIKWNLLGQISLPHTLGWMGISIAICFKNDLIRLLV